MSLTACRKFEARLAVSKATVQETAAHAADAALAAQAGFSDANPTIFGEHAAGSGEQTSGVPRFGGMPPSEKNRCVFLATFRATWRQGEANSDRWQGQFQGH